MLGFVVADLLFREFPDFDEGQKSKIKAALVSTTTLARLAERLALGDHLLLGRGEEKTGGRRKQALLADGYEALIAAIYLDGGIEQARAFVAREFAPLLADVAAARRGAGRTTSRRCRSWLQSRERAAAGVPARRHARPRSSQAVPGGSRRARRARSPRRPGASKKEAEQEAATRSTTRATISNVDRQISMPISRSR